MTISHLTACVKLPLYGKGYWGSLHFCLSASASIIVLAFFWATASSSMKEFLRTRFFHITLSWSWNKRNCLIYCGYVSEKHHHHGLKLWLISNSRYNTAIGKKKKKGFLLISVTDALYNKRSCINLKFLYLFKWMDTKCQAVWNHCKDFFSNWNPSVWFMSIYPPSVLTVSL